MGRKRSNSRPARWADAVSRAQSATEGAKEEIQGALDDLKALQEESQEWRDNLPEGLDQSPVAEKLDAVIEIDLESVDLDEVFGWIDEAEGADLPRGFGQD